MAGGTDWLMDGTEKTKVPSLQLSKTAMAKTLHLPQAAPSPQKIPMKPQVDQREAKRICVCVMAGLKNPRVAFNQELLKAVPKNKMHLFSLTRAQSPFPKICGMVP